MRRRSLYGWHPRPRSSHELDDFARKEALEMIRKREAEGIESPTEREETQKNHTAYKSKLSDWVSRTRAIRTIMPWIIAGVSWGYLRLSAPYMHPWSMIIISVLIGVVISRFQDLMVNGLWGEGVDIIIEKLDQPKRRQKFADMVETGEDVEPIPDPIGRAPDREPYEGDTVTEG